MPIVVEVVSPVRQLYHTEKADMVIVPGSEGELGVLPNHAPLLTTMSFGELRIVEGEDIASFVIYGGVVEVRPDRVTVLADDAESVVELDMDEVEAARARARDLMATAPDDAARHAIVQELRRAEIAARVHRRAITRRGGIRSLEEDETL